MRDILVTVVIFGSIPLILARPYIGILMWSWVGYMNPHRLTWDFAFDMPFAQIIAVATLLGLIFDKEPKRIPITPLTGLWVVFIVWMIVTTLFALVPENAYPELERVIKIQFMTFLTMMVMNTKKRLNLLIWVIALSIGFFSVKGGVFTLVRGGVSRVYGPPGGFISENNALALATLMTIPLMYYLRLQSANRWVRLGLVGAIVLSAVSALGSYSRGGVLAAIAVAVFFWWRSQRKLITTLILLVLIPPLLLFMPQAWTDRMMAISEEREASIEDIEAMRQWGGVTNFSAPISSRDWFGRWPTDRSALGRINAWNYSINVANDRLTGAGFESWTRKSFAEYAPIVEAVLVGHSIYFSVLADHGWIGLAMFFGILWLAWRNSSWVIRQSKADPELKWLGDLARVIQLTLVAYMVGGAFLSLAYFDLAWHLIALVVIARALTERYLNTRRADAVQDLPAPTPLSR